MPFVSYSLTWFLTKSSDLPCIICPVYWHWKKKNITMSWHSDSWEKVVMPRNTKWSLVMIDIIWLFFNMLCEGMTFSSGFLKILLQEQNLKFWFPCWNSPHSHGWGLELRGTVQANKFLFFVLECGDPQMLPEEPDKLLYHRRHKHPLVYSCTWGGECKWADCSL